MKSFRHTFLLFLIVLLLVNCEKIILGEDASNNPENNFELLWQDFEQHYALFEVKQIDWKDLYEIYRPQINTNTSDTELWQVISSMLEELNDGHVTLHDLENGNRFESGFELTGKALEEFDLSMLKANYLDDFVQTSEIDLSYAKIRNKNIGYIHYYGVGGEDATVIDQVIAALRDQKAIILDLRNNGGGNDEYAHRVAGVFSDGEHLIYTVQTRNGEKYDDFDEKTPWFTQVEGKEQFLKPVILLTDRFTASGAEILSLNMRAFDHVTHLGDTTAGDFSDASFDRYLPNNWTYTYSTQLYLLPNGESLEGIGIAPEILIKNTKADIQAGKDLVLERALLYLLEEYGIE